MSCLLFHGPNARQEALNQAHRTGRLLVPPLGDDGLKIDDVREIADLLLSTPVGDQTGVVVVGPMDHASPKAGDGLLKSIEEFADVVAPILWATDLGGVSPTIRSRCLAKWCPALKGGAQMIDDDPVEEDGRLLAEAALTGQVWKIAPLVKKYNTKEYKRLDDLISVVVSVFALSTNPKALVLWDQLREVLKYNNPQMIEIIAGLMLEDAE